MSNSDAGKGDEPRPVDQEKWSKRYPECWEPGCKRLQEKGHKYCRNHLTYQKRGK